MGPSQEVLALNARGLGGRQSNLGISLFMRVIGESLWVQYCMIRGADVLYSRIRILVSYTAWKESHRAWCVIHPKSVPVGLVNH